MLIANMIIALMNWEIIQYSFENNWLRIFLFFLIRTILILINYKHKH